MPCSRCSVAGSTCLYEHSSRKKAHAGSKSVFLLCVNTYPSILTVSGREVSHLESQLSQMQEQIQQLTSQISATKNTSRMMAEPREFQSRPPQERRSVVSQDVSPTPSSVRGPTSPEFTLELARSRLIAGLGIASQRVSLEGSQLKTAPANGSELLVEHLPLAKPLLKDPLRYMPRAEAERLIRIFQEGPGAINPIVEEDDLNETCKSTFDTLEATQSAHSTRALIIAAELLGSPKVITLKLVLANASTIDTCGIDDRTRSIFESIRKPLASYFWALPSLQMIQHWLLVVGSGNGFFCKMDSADVRQAILHFQIDEELQASRVAAYAARLCLELGINRPNVIQQSFKTDSDCTFAIKLVNNAFVLDHRSSLGIGIPPTIPDGDFYNTPTSTEVSLGFVSGRNHN